MLICVDCGAPLDERQTPQSRRQRLVAAATLCGFAMAGGLIFTLTELNRSAGELELVNREQEAGGEAGGEAGAEGLAGGLLDPPLSARVSAGAAPEAAAAEAAVPAPAQPPALGPAER
jgi:hypothetical protein